MCNILKPELLWIEGRCYRVNDSTTEITALQEHDLYENEVTFNDPDNDEDMEDFEVTMVGNDRFTTSVHVSKHYYGFIIGKKGATKMRMERDTRTTIKIPRPGQAGDIVIFGPSADNVRAAKRRINIIVMSSRMKQKFTHFVSIPVNQPAIVEHFESFKEAVLRDCKGSKGLEESLFIKGSKLHITVGVMCLMDNEERLHVSQLFTEAKEKIIMPLIQDHLPLKIRLKGLSYMNDDPREIHILYGDVKEEGAPPGVLQTLTDSLVQYFYKAGFMDKGEYGREHVKMHVTLLNSKYRGRTADTTTDPSTEPNVSRTRKVTFDGTEILKKFGDYDFGVAEMSDIHLSQRHAMGPDGYYQATCVISCKI